MKLFGWTIVICAALLLQTTVTILDVSPNITVLLAYYCGIRFGETKGMFSGMAVGLLQDSLALSIIGPHLLSKGVIGFLSSRFIPGGFLRWTPLLGILALSGLTVVDNALVFMAKSLFDKVPAEPYRAVYISIMQAFLNAPAGIFIKPIHAE